MWELWGGGSSAQLRLAPPACVKHSDIIQVLKAEAEIQLLNELFKRVRDRV